MAYYVCPTCGAPLTLADPPSLSSRDRPQYDTPQLATCPRCGRLERGPLSERRMRQAPWAYVLAIAIVLGVYWALWVVFTQLGDKAPVVTTFMTFGGAGITIGLVAWALIAIPLQSRKMRRLMAEWQPLRREGDPPKGAGRLPRAAASTVRPRRHGIFVRRILPVVVLVLACAVSAYAVYWSFQSNHERHAAQTALTSFSSGARQLRDKQENELLRLFKREEKADVFYARDPRPRLMRCAKEYAASLGSWAAKLVALHAPSKLAGARRTYVEEIRAVQLEWVGVSKEAKRCANAPAALTALNKKWYRLWTRTLKGTGEAGSTFFTALLHEARRLDMKIY